MNEKDNFKEYFKEESLKIFLDQEHIKRRTSNRLLFYLYRAFPYALQFYHDGKLTKEVEKFWQDEDEETQKLAHVICEDLNRLRGKIYISSIEEFYKLSTREQWYLLSAEDRKFIHNHWLQI